MVRRLIRDSPIDIIPLFVKAGSIIPVGPKVQYATEKKWDNLEIRIYPGANGEYTFYEDEKDNYNYEKGAFSTITFNWNDSKKILTINDRKGSFTGMIESRKFNIVIVDKTKGTGADPGIKFDKEITYSGEKNCCKFITIVT